MWFTKHKQPRNGAVNEKVAGVIAGRIIKWQRKASTHLNERANRYSKASQMRWFWLFCGLALTGLVCSVVFTSRIAQMPRISNSVLPIHIGQSSEGPPKPHAPTKTDSLNHQK